MDLTQKVTSVAWKPWGSQVATRPASMRATPVATIRPVTTTGELLVDCVRRLGVDLVFAVTGSELAELPWGEVRTVSEPDAAIALADAAGRLGAGPGVALLGGRTLHLGSQPGLSPDPVIIADVADLPGALAGWDVGTVFATADYELDLDLRAPVPGHVQPVQLDERNRDVTTLSPDLAALSMIVLAGPGVVRAGQVDALRSLARTAGCGVLNTWGAKGVFAWDDPAHLGTAGLQVRDFELGGVLDAELVVATGLDPFESPPDLWLSGFVVEADPRDLDALVFRWSPSSRVPARPRLYTELQAALAPLYADDDVPLAPARATGDLGQVRPPGGLVLADPGPAGLWVARTFPTTELASIIVPSHSCVGFSVAGAIVAGLRGRVALSITAGPVEPLVGELLDVAAAWSTPVTLEVWGSEGRVGTPVTRVVQTADALQLPTIDVLEIPVDLSRTSVLTDVAGPVVAWQH